MNNDKKQDSHELYIVLDGVNFKKRELTGKKLRDGRCTSCEAVFGIHKDCLMYGSYGATCGCKMNENYVKVNDI